MPLMSLMPMNQRRRCLRKSRIVCGDHTEADLSAVGCLSFYGHIARSRGSAILQRQISFEAMEAARLTSTIRHCTERLTLIMTCILSFTKILWCTSSSLSHVWCPKVEGESKCFAFTKRGIVVSTCCCVCRPQLVYCLKFLFLLESENEPECIRRKASFVVQAEGLVH